MFEKTSTHQVELLYRSYRIAQIAALINVGILSFVQWPIISPTLIVTWSMGMLLIAGYRAVLSHQFLRQPPEDRSAPVWAWRFAIGSSVASVGWGLAAIMLFPEDQIAHQVFLAFIVAGMAAGAVTTLSAVFAIAAVFLTLMLFPLGLRLLMTGDFLPMVMGGMTFAFWAFLLANSRRSANNILDMIGARTRVERREKELSRFKTTLDLTMDCVFMFDPRTLKFIYANKGALAQLGYGYDEMMCMTPFDIKPDYGESEFHQFIQPMIDGEKNTVNFETVHEHKDGTRIPVEIFLQYIKPQDDAPRFVAIVRDASKRNELTQELTDYASTLGRLHDISAGQNLTLKDKIEQVLDLGLDVFGLDIGIISHIKDDEYHVDYIRGPDGVPAPGTVFPFNETYYAHTYTANGPTGFHAAGDSEIRNHPCYLNFKLESYLGTPIYVDGERYGTINFSSPEKQDKPFSHNHHLLIQLFAEWIGNELSRQSKNARIHSILDTMVDGVITINHEGLIETVNPAVEKLFAYSREDILGQNVAMLMPEPDYHQHDQYLQNYQETGLVKIIGAGRELEGRRRDGSLFPLELAVSEMRIGDQRMFTGVLRDISERKQTEAELAATYAELTVANDRLKVLSLQDGLTGIANRRNFDLTLDKEYQAAMRNHRFIAVIMCDIDYFKQFNDSYGHSAGDDCLREIARGMQQVPSRPNDTVARYGGEEFAVILPDTDLVGAKVVAESLRQAVWKLNILHASSDAADRVTLSLGVAATTPERGSLLTDLLKQADQALYDAKSRGRNQAQVFHQA